MLHWHIQPMEAKKAEETKRQRSVQEKCREEKIKGLFEAERRKRRKKKKTDQWRRILYKKNTNTVSDG